MAEATEREEAQERLNARMKFLAQAVEMLRAGGQAAVQASLAGLRSTIPLLEAYSGVRAADYERSEEDPREQVTFLGLDPGQAAVVKAAGAKVMLEAIQIASITDPIMEDAPRFTPYNDKGEAQAPHLMHVLAFGAMVQRLWGDFWPEPPDAEPPQLPYDPTRTVAYVAQAPGEYAVASAPLAPREIRRYAMRRRAMNQPPPAMLASSSDPTSIVAAPTTDQRMMMRSQPMMMSNQPSAATNQPTTITRSGAGISSAPMSYTAPAGAGAVCGGSVHHTHYAGCGCGGAGQGWQSPPARYRDDGSCAPLGEISCETRWRIRECFKVAFCDLLRCMAEEFCEDGRFVTSADNNGNREPDFGRCLEGLVCSILTCLPEAICPPPPKETSCCCRPGSAQHCRCNFAVEEWVR